MKQSKARLVIYGIWFFAFAFSMFSIELASMWRRNVIDPADTQNALVKVAALYVPILTAFGTFWFRKRTAAPQISITPERWWGALSTTVFFQLLFLTRIIHTNYFEAYSSIDGQPRTTYLELMSSSVEIGLLLFPLVTLPVAYLLGIEELSANSSAPGDQ